MEGRKRGRKEGREGGREGGRGAYLSLELDEASRGFFEGRGGEMHAVLENGENIAPNRLERGGEGGRGEGGRE